MRKSEENLIAGSHSGCTTAPANSAARRIAYWMNRMKKAHPTYSLQHPTSLLPSLGHKRKTQQSAATRALVARMYPGWSVTMPDSAARTLGNRDSANRPAAESEIIARAVTTSLTWRGVLSLAPRSRLRASGVIAPPVGCRPILDGKGRRRAVIRRSLSVSGRPLALLICLVPRSLEQAACQTLAGCFGRFC